MGRKVVKKLAKKAPKVIFEAATGKRLDDVVAKTKAKPKKKQKSAFYVVDDGAIELMRRQLADVGCKLHVGIAATVHGLQFLAADTLSRIAFRLQEVEADGNCLFRALGDQLYGDQHQHEEVRKYCERMREDGTWGGNQELYAAARLFQVYVVVHQDQPSARIMVIECDRLKPTRFVHVAYHGEDHYDSVRALKDPVDPDSLPVSIELDWDGFRPEDFAKRWQTHASASESTSDGQPEQRVVPNIPTDTPDAEVDSLASRLGKQLQVAAGKTLSKKEQRQLRKAEKAAKSVARKVSTTK
ncbi:OTU domain-containing protein 3 [Phytophthora nicotianae]|uniref:OTU domain-containing protein 3 n=1 Tax=Phytophthora nicotianae TaxID=4792 RepID=A0A0W8C0K0_PHYNI|nr:OTU domain-containing protein 3 [Phytophthora nicotianae]KUF83384.1 OTU domain-containing protein 3 [Phytophthora nicotianae]